MRERLWYLQPTQTSAGGSIFLSFFFLRVSSLFLFLFFFSYVGMERRYLKEIRGVPWLPFEVKSQQLSPLELILTLNAKPKPTGTLKPGCQRLVKLVVLDWRCSGYRENHFAGIVLGGSIVAKGEGGVYLSCLAEKTCVKWSCKKIQKTATHLFFLQGG
jgi:hypothetical protein